MKIQKIIFSIIIVCCFLTSCKTAVKKENISLAISGMTCEIGCAKLIQSKLSKKGGITSAKVIFKDSLGLVEYDANTISAKDINAFINGIAGGDLYNVKSSKQVKTFDQVEK